MPFLNRDAYLVKPKKKYADWIRYVDETSKDESDESLLKESGTIYLLEELDSGSSDEAEAELSKYWRKIAASEFDTWWTNEDDWPRLKSIADFDEYFDSTYVEMVHDLCGTAITRE